MIALLSASRDCSGAFRSSDFKSQLKRRVFFGVLGVGLLGLSMPFDLAAQLTISSNPQPDKIREASEIILSQLEGGFGALVMVAAGLGAILSAAFGQYRASLSLLIVSVGAFVLRTLVDIFFTQA